MLVQVGEQFPIPGRLLRQPGALLGGEVVQDLRSTITINLAHGSKDTG